MQKHTPGPWTVTEVGPATRYMVAGAATSVAMTYGQSGQQADARLIAAAPDLLAALAEIDKLAREAYTDANSRAVLCLQVGLIAQIALDKFTTSS